MGIKGLNKLIGLYASSAISQKHISDFKGSRVAIDSEILIHKYRSLDSKNSHIFGFINNVCWHLENGIIPIYVFDGCPSIIKQENVLTKRNSYREQMGKRLEELENKFIEQLDYECERIDGCIGSTGINTQLTPEINDILDQLMKIKRKINFMTAGKNHHNECKYLLKLLGIPFVVADDDAEAFCVILQKQGIADYVYTEDTDVIPYFVASMSDLGSPSHSSRPSVKIFRKGPIDSMVTVIDVEEILSQLGLAPRSFIDMCILSGCDFCPALFKNNPVKSYIYMQRYQSIENLAKEGSINIPEEFKYQEARDMFFKCRELQVEKNLVLGTMNVIGLRSYLIEERGLNPVPIIDKYSRIYAKLEIDKTLVK